MGPGRSTRAHGRAIHIPIAACAIPGGKIALEFRDMGAIDCWPFCVMYIVPFIAGFISWNDVCGGGGAK